MAGKLVVFEGIDGSGKTTQLQGVFRWLQGQSSQASADCPLVVTREPGGTPLGEDLRRLLLGTSDLADRAISERAELFLYAADRAQHVSRYLEPQLARGAIVLCDRFVDSTVAYQGYGRGVDLGKIHFLNGLATGGLTADLTLWFDVPVEVGLLRRQGRSGKGDRLERSDLAFHHRVREGFQTLAQLNPERIVRIDAEPSMQVVACTVRNILKHRFKDWYGFDLMDESPVID